MRILKLCFAAIVMVLTTGDLLAQRDCRITVAPTNIFLGDYSVFSSPGSALQVPFTVEVDCVPPGRTRVTLSPSSTTGQYTPRSMVSAGELLPYNVFLDAVATQVFGDGTGGTHYRDFIGTPGNKVAIIPLYFRTTLGADAAAGFYSDTLNLELRDYDPPHALVSATPFTVTVNVLKECQVSTFTLPFGNYDPIGAHSTAPLTANTTVNVLCTRGVSGRVTMSPGNNPAGGMRQMAFGANRLQYNLFTNAARTFIWDTSNWLSGMSTSKFTPLGGGLIGYGAIAPGQTTAPPGSYYDTLVATVTY